MASTENAAENIEALIGCLAGKQCKKRLTDTQRTVDGFGVEIVGGWFSSKTTLIGNENVVHDGNSRLKSELRLK